MRRAGVEVAAIAARFGLDDVLDRLQQRVAELEDRAGGSGEQRDDSTDLG